MHRYTAAAVLLVLFLASLRFSAAADPKEAWLPLVTKQDPAGEIVGWKSFSEKPGTKTSDVWQLTDDGVLICRGTPNGYLSTEKDYTDFVLRLQWHWPANKPGKGGVLLRKTGPDKIWPASLEAQLNYPDAGDFWGLDGYKLAGPTERMKQLDNPQFGHLTNLRRAAEAEKPVGQWNTYEIRVSGGTVVLAINGQEVNRTGNCDVHPGKICLTSEGSEIHFRQVELLAKDSGVRP